MELKVYYKTTHNGYITTYNMANLTKRHENSDEDNKYIWYDTVQIWFSKDSCNIYTSENSECLTEELLNTLQTGKSLFAKVITKEEFNNVLNKANAWIDKHSEITNEYHKLLKEISK